MSRSAKIAILVIIALLALGVVVWAMQDRDTTDTDTTVPPPTSEQQPSSNEGTTPETSEAEVAATITYTDEGFSIDSATVPAGSTVRITNASQSQLDFTSNPHPTHEDLPELTVGLVGPGESRTFTITQAGTWGFHNHERESHTGRITVQ